PETQTLNINAFRYTNPISEQIVNQIYTTVIKRTPKLWDMIYDNPEVKKRLDKIKNAVHKMNTPKFARLFEKFTPDIVICTQAFPCGMVADYKKTCGSDIKLIAVLTDYIPHSYWVYDAVDLYITPSEEVSKRLILKGVPAEKIKPLGIPFDPKFNVPVDKDKVYHKLNLNPDLKTVLIMGGGQGLGPIKTIVKALEKVKSDFQEIIVTGTNKKLYKSLKKKIKKYKKKIHLLGYVDNVNELMTISHAIVTKPGGITTSEALSKKLPMLILRPIPGQEESNTVYLTGKKAAIRITKPKQVTHLIEDLFTDSHKLKSMAEAAGHLAKPNAAMDIAKLALSL
ncbi:MAG: UDP-N-acetylglucosamine 2-epimerase, partial [Candidatus Omnitrophica bacterium]|nr:UDP-N-acetylglucosamine 2-epimerase [Candidatus Omnitrophota bacterium]